MSRVEETSIRQAARAVDLARGLRLEWVTIGWNCLEAVVAIGAGIVAGSIALVGFGLDSVIEVLAGAVVLWRLRAELQGADAEASARAERRALAWVGWSFFALAAYILFESGKKLLWHERPDESPVGLALAVLSLIVMPALALAKHRTARRLQSRALAADAKETAICAYLSLALVLGLGLNAWTGWWWADPVAALAMLPLVVHEGREALEAARVPSPPPGARAG
jgi:cation diffusion facilitator family transporter